MKVKDVEEAIRLANDSSYGLSASVWTRDRAHGEQIARRLETGAVNVYDMFVNTFAIRIPQGGWKESGVGARLDDAHGIRKYCRPQAVTATRLAPDRSSSGTPTPPSGGQALPARHSLPVRT
jgi:acyl-CoA reductase-like NAD-dependent aldehyde dehydrogenase